MGQGIPGNAESPKETLDRILAALKSGNTETQRAGILELGTRPYSSSAIIAELERLALTADAELRALALTALGHSSSRAVYKQNSSLSPYDRGVIFSEINIWQKNGLLDEARATILKQRYGFDIVPATQATTEPAPASPTGTMSTAIPAPRPEPVKAAPKPRPTLTETLLSESSIKIALYLGAFLVIASAAILAALVEVARLPVLAVVTLGFGIGALATHKRLPQPSFVLFIVFSCLLPFDAAVLKDMLALRENFNNLYWGAVYLLIGGIWVFSAWFYASRFFSAAAFVALDLGVSYFITFFQLDYEVTWLGLSLTGLIGLMGVYLLKRWKDAKFAAPLFGLTLLHTFILIGALSLGAVVRGFSQSAGSDGRIYWIVSALTWGIISGFFLAANWLYPFIGFPWAVTLCLLPIPWFFLQTFDLSALVFVIVLWASGAIYAFSSEVILLLNKDKLRQYHWPLLIQSYLPILIAWIWGAFENVSYGFGVALATAFIYFLLTLRKPRVLAWTSSLVAALTAYFSFFGLPLIERLHIASEYLVTAAALVLLLPDMFLRADLKDNKTLRWPPRILGALLFSFSFLMLISEGFNSAGHRAIALALFALLALGYAFRYQKAFIVYLFAGLLTFAAFETLDQFNVASTLWLPTFTGLSVTYYLTGSLLKSGHAKPFRYSALILVGLSVSVAALEGKIQSTGWYSLVAAALFAVEQYRFKSSLMEPGILLFTSIAWAMIVHQFFAYPFAAKLLDARYETGIQWIGISVISILLELALKLTYREARKLNVLSVAAAATITAGTSIYLILFGFDHPRIAAIGFNIFMLTLIANALVRRAPKLGYSATAAAALAVIFALRDFGQTKWLFPLIALAIAFYLIGYILREFTEKLSPTHLLAGWDATLLNSGLALGTLLALSAPFENSGLAAAIPVALAATLWTAEAFARRNVWLGFPSNGLYLMAYFMILNALKVDQPQFYSVGASALGLLMHYLLTRSGSRTGAFLTGMVSQLVLLSTTYIQMVSTNQLGFFVVLFFQGLAVLVYGIVIRSRSLVITPILFIVLGVITVIYSALKGISTVIVIGCTGIILLLLGILAVVLRERLIKIGERFSDWSA